MLSEISIHAFIQENQIKTEQGTPLNFDKHLFLFDPYRDFSPKQVIFKAAQIGFSTLAINKAFWLAKNKGLNIIYTLPTDSDVKDFVGGKVNRIIAQNPIYQEWTKDRDTIEQKSIGDAVLYYRGTWNSKSAIMVSSDLNVYDEVDSCYEPDTEVLTRLGWKKIQDITKEDIVCTLNQKYHSVSFQHPTEIISSNYNGNLYRFLANQIDIAVTENHNMWARTASYGGFQGRSNKHELHKAPKLLNEKFVLTSRGIWGDHKKNDELINIPYIQSKKKGKRVSFKARKVDTLAFYEFLGWYISEGNVYKYRNSRGEQKASGDIIITQKDGVNMDKIKDCITRLGYKYKVSFNKRNVGSIKIKDLQLALFLQTLGYSKDKRVPKRYLYTKKKYLTVLLDAMILGDGDDRNVITTKSKGLADDIQVIALQLGKTSSIYYEPVAGVYRAGIIQKPYRRFNKFRNSNPTGRVIKEKYKGRVYCLTVNNGVILVRGKDKKVPIWSGNSKQAIVEQYSTRLQHSKYKWEWYFSHPSAPGIGVDKYWGKSDQKKWFIKCPHCGVSQFLSFPESIDLDKKIFICKKCRKEIKDRTHGEWKPTKKGEFSGYWIPLLIAPWVSAEEIVGYYKEKSEEYFFNKVLGLPYVGGGNKLTKTHFDKNLTERNLTPEKDERVVIGVDTGKKLHYVCGGLKGLFYYAEAKDYDEIENLMIRWSRAIAVIDQGGDLIGSRKLRDKYPGRVFLCTFGTDRKTKELVRWGKNDEQGAVLADRNRTIQMTVDEFVDKKIPVEGTGEEWYDYWCLDGGTMITTNKGLRKIKDIEVGEKVLTREGYKKVYKSGVSHPNADVVEVTFSNGTKLIATSKHKVFVKNKGFITIDSLSHCDIIEICNQNLSHIIAISIIDTLIHHIGVIGHIIVVVKNLFIEKFGKIIKEKYQKILLFTIKTITNLTIQSKISSVYQKQNIIHIILTKNTKTQCIGKRCCSGLKNKFKQSLIKLGIIHQKELGELQVLTERKTVLICIARKISKSLLVKYAVRSIENLTKGLTNTVRKGVGFIRKIIFKIGLKRNVSSAVKSLRRINTGVQKLAQKNVAVISKVKLKEKIPVYNLSVEDQHEYYANGVLVSNCHWNNLTRVKEEDPKTGEIKRKIWVRSGDDHWALATTYWRVGMDRFGFTNGEIISSKSIKEKKAPYIINESMPAINPYERFKRRDDWRNL